MAWSCTNPLYVSRWVKGSTLWLFCPCSCPLRPSSSDGLSGAEKHLIWKWLSSSSLSSPS